MSQNPYATYGSPTESAPQARTSVLAILSLVCSLICCLPGLSILGTLLGSVAILRISASNGRRKGVGLAIAGIVIGLFVSVVYIGAFILTSQAIKEMMGVGSLITNNLSTTDASELRKQLSTQQAARLTDAQWANFRSEISAEIGTLKPLPDNIFSYTYQIWSGFAQYGKASGRKGRAQNMKANLPPIPITGDKGTGVMMIELDGDPTGDAKFNLSILHQVVIYTSSGKAIKLFKEDADPALPGSPATPADRQLPPAPATPPAPPAAPGPSGV